MKITHRTPGARGLLHGVAFKNGIGHSDDPAVLARMRAAGHQVEDGRAISDPPDPDVEIDDRTFADAVPLEADPWTAPQA